MKSIETKFNDYGHYFSVSVSSILPISRLEAEIHSWCTENIGKEKIDFLEVFVSTYQSIDELNEFVGEINKNQLNQWFDSYRSEFVFLNKENAMACYLVWK